ncbi:MAG: hypothetical protein ACRDTO_13325 [Mycobacterium sp.]
MVLTSLQQVITNVSGPADVAGWIAVVTTVWRAGRRVGKIEERLESLAVNHLPHLQAELESLPADIRTLWQSAMER